MNRRIAMKQLKRRNKWLEDENRFLHDILNPRIPISANGKHRDIATLETTFQHVGLVPKDVAIDILAQNFYKSISKFIQYYPPRQVNGYLGTTLEYRARLKVVVPDKGDDIYEK